jgi:hypothetical protein
MASFARRPQTRAAWSVDRRPACSSLRSIKEYELLQLLSWDKKALWRRRVNSASASLICNRNRPAGQPLMVVGHLRCPTHRLLLQRRCSVGQMLVNDAVQRAVRSATCDEHKCEAPLNAGYHLHCAVARICQNNVRYGTRGFPFSDPIFGSCSALSTKRGRGGAILHVPAPPLVAGGAILLDMTL